MLSGGGARGLAHLGVLHAMCDLNIPINIISGVSAGAIVGAFYADGYHPREVLQFFRSHKITQLLRLVYPRSGFMRATGLKTILKKNLRTKNIEDLETPLVIAATNFKDGKIEYIDKGNLVQALLASSSIPIVFELSEFNNVPYLDGGVMNNFPVEPIRQLCKKIYAVHVNPLGQNVKPGGPVQIAERAFHLAIASDIENKKKWVDHFIEPQTLRKYGLFDVNKAMELYLIGYQGTRDVLCPKK